jgi:hypothetical protein
VDDCSPTELDTVLLELDSVRSSVRLRACHKTQTPPAPVSSRAAAPRQLIRRLSRRPLLLGVSSSVKASGLVAFSCPAPRRDLSPLVRSAREPRRVTPSRVSIWRDVRMILYAVSRTSSDYPVSLQHRVEWGQIPFGPAIQPLGRLQLTTLPYLRRTFYP